MIYSLISVKNTINNKPSSGKNVSFKAAPIPYKLASELNAKLLDPAIKSFDIFCHASPDEDTVNVGKVLNNYLKKHGKKMDFCVCSPKLKGLFLGHGKFNIKNNSEPADAALVLDFSSKSKVSRQFADVLNKSKKLIGFDHHQVTSDAIYGFIYRDDTAYSCCGVLYRFFESIGEKLKKNDLKSLYCGMLSDYQKSKLIKFDNASLIKLPALEKDPNSKEILEKIGSQLSDKEKMKIHKHIDVLSRLSPQEQAFRKSLFPKINVTPNGKLAYVVIEPDDKEWISLGMKNTKTSPILRDLRLRLLNGVQSDDAFTASQKEQFKDLKGAIVFYRAGHVYQMSIHTKDEYANDLIKYVKTNLNPNLTADGHPNRAGGRIFTLDKNEVNTFINNFLIAAEKLDS